MIVGGLIFEVAMIVPQFAQTPITVWDEATVRPLVWTIVAATVIALAATFLFRDAMIPLALATGCSFFLFGQWFLIVPVFGDYSFYGLGFWLGVGAAVSMSLAGTVALIASVTTGFANSPRAAGSIGRQDGRTR